MDDLDELLDQSLEDFVKIELERKAVAEPAQASAGQQPTNTGRGTSSAQEDRQERQPSSSATSTAQNPTDQEQLERVFAQLLSAASVNPSSALPNDGKARPPTSSTAREKEQQTGPSSSESPRTASQDAPNDEAMLQQVTAMFEKLAQASARDRDEEPSADDPRSAPDAELSADKLVQMLMGALGGDAGGDEDEEDEDSLMDGLLSTLVSKDMLYPSLRELTTHYPSWLEENKDALSQEDLHRYREQHRLIAQIVTIYEEEDDHNSAAQASSSSTPTGSSSQTSRRVLEIMEQIQEHGHPPASLVQRLGIEIDASGLPTGLAAMRDSAANCQIM